MDTGDQEDRETNRGKQSLIMFRGFCYHLLLFRKESDRAIQINRAGEDGVDGESR